MIKTTIIGLAGEKRPRAGNNELLVLRGATSLLSLVFRSLEKSKFLGGSGRKAKSGRGKAYKL